MRSARSFLNTLCSFIQDVGAALRGRPLSNSTASRSAGGHRGPHVQALKKRRFLLPRLLRVRWLVFPPAPTEQPTNRRLAFASHRGHREVRRLESRLTHRLRSVHQILVADVFIRIDEE